MFSSFKFKIAGFFDGCDEIQIIQDKYDEDEYELNIESFFEIKFDMPKRVSPLIVQLLMKSLMKLVFENGMKSITIQMF